MTSKPLRETIRTALHDEWWRSIHEKIEDSPDGHVGRLTEVVAQALEPVIRAAYGRGRDEEAAGAPIPEEYTATWWASSTASAGTGGVTPTTRSVNRSTWPPRWEHDEMAKVTPYQQTGVDDLATWLRAQWDEDERKVAAMEREERRCATSPIRRRPGRRRTRSTPGSSQTVRRREQRPDSVANAARSGPTVGRRSCTARTAPSPRRATVLTMLLTDSTVTTI